MYDILSILVGKWFLGGIGYCARKVYSLFLNFFCTPKKTIKGDSEYSHVIDINEYQNRITGFIVILIIIIVVQILQAI